MQLTDGTVLVQGFQGQDWYKLTPDINGSYVNGTWTQMASLASNYDPYAMAEAVLADGRVLIEGGEYNFGTFSFTNLGEIYDPVTNTWTPLTPPHGWGLHRRFAFRSTAERTLPDRQEVRYADGRAGSQHHDVDGDGLLRQERLERRGGLDADSGWHAVDG